MAYDMTTTHASYLQEWGGRCGSLVFDGHPAMGRAGQAQGGGVGQGHLIGTGASSLGPLYN